MRTTEPRTLAGAAKDGHGSATNVPGDDRHDEKANDPSAARTGPVTAFEFHNPIDRRKNLSKLPARTIGALRLVWIAAPRQLTLTLIFQVAMAGALGIQLLVARHILNDLIAIHGHGSAMAILPGLGVLVATTALISAVGAVSAQQQQLLTELVARHVFDRIIGVSTTVNLEAIETPGFYDQLYRAKTSGLVRSVELVTSVNSLLTGLFTSVGISVALAVLQPLLLPLVLLAAVPVLIATIRNSREAYSFEYSLTAQNRERAYLMELLTEREPAKELRVFSSIGFLRARYAALTDERIQRMREFLRQRMKVALVGTAGGSLAMLLALLSLALLLAKNKIDVATAVTAGVAMQQLGIRLAMLMTSVGKIIESGLFIDDYNEFLERADENTPHPATTNGSRVEATGNVLQKTGVDRGFEGLRVAHAHFTYPNTDALVLDDVSLEVGPGEVVALVGENGSGKTTLVKLICQLYKPQHGRLVWNGIDVRNLPPGDIADDITVIFQDFIQYHLSALDNVALGRVERQPRLEDVMAAANQAGAHDFISRLPQLYDTQLGRQFYGGHELSIGQWQRLALARAFFRGGNFLVLDEPTASLDPKAEHDLFSQMRELSKGRSVLLVSHRFSSVRAADRIYVLQGGRITESGTHEALMELNGHYAELFSLQADAYLGEQDAETA